MLVRDAMTFGVGTIGANESIAAAARRMRDEGIGALVVNDDGGHVAGIITDRDITIRTVADGMDPRRTFVHTAMTPQVVECLDHDELEAAVMRMERGAVRRVVVMDGAHRLVGVLSVDDVALRSPALAGEILEHVRAPERPIQRGPWPWWEEEGLERRG
jgi:CBS domain-containing protein